MIGGEYSNKNVSTGEMHAQNSASDLSNMLNQTHTNAQPIGKVRPFHLQERFVNVPLDTFSPSFVQKLSAATTSEGCLKCLFYCHLDYSISCFVPICFRSHIVYNCFQCYLFFT